MNETRLIELEMLAAANPGTRSAPLIVELVAEVRALQARLATRQRTAARRGAFVPPTIAEVAAFFREGDVFASDPDDAAESFVDYYETQKWRKANGLPMESWKGCARTWEKKEKADRARRSPSLSRAAAVPRL